MSAAVVGLIGLFLGLIIRDWLLQLHFFRKKREAEIEDQVKKRQSELQTIYRAELIGARDVVRLYADPLLRSAKSLNYRLKEVLEQRGRATFLLLHTPQSEFSLYKRISTLYRLAALLAWICAYRKERSYLDPADATKPSEVEKAVEGLESALADGPHVENQRLNELLRIWVPCCPDISESTKKDLAVALDNLLRESLTENGKTSALELTEADKNMLCQRAAEIISNGLNVNIPSELIVSESPRAIGFFGIKEAYVYRDWQQAIGELLLSSSPSNTRRFDVIGYHRFEALFLSTEDATESERRWIRRLDKIFVGLDPHKEDVFDARRNQLRAVYAASTHLQSVLEQKIHEYSLPTETSLSKPTDRVSPRDVLN